MFKRIKIVEAIYKGVAPSKITQRSESERSSSGRNKKVGLSALTSNPEQVRASKRKINNAGHPSDELTSVKNTYLMHGPGHSLEDCKFPKEDTKKRSAQHTYKYNQSRSGGNKRAKVVKFEEATQEVNTVKSHD